MSTFIRHLHPPEITTDDVEAVSRLLRTPLLGYNMTRALEEHLAAFTGFEYCIAVNTATMGLTCALKAVGVMPNDIVYVPALTFMATWNAVAAAGGRPSFFDVDAESWVGPDRLYADGAEHAPIITVDLHGVDSAGKVPADDRPWIVDAAASLAPARQWPVRVPDLMVVSFNTNKGITGLGGGAVFTNSRSYADSVRRFADHAKVGTDATRPGLAYGFNGRIQPMSAALVLSQMSRYAEIADHHATINHWYRTALEGMVEFQGGRILFPWITCVKAASRAKRDTAIKALHAAGFEARRMYQLPVGCGCPNALELADTAFQLPSGLDITQVDVLAMASVVRAALG